MIKYIFSETRHRLKEIWILDAVRNMRYFILLNNTV